MTAGDTQVEGVPELIDARCDGLGRADLIFVFGTREHEPARLAGDAYQAGLAPIVVVTGGAARQVDGLNEAQSHRQLLLHRGVPDSAILVEDRSTHTGENVDFALELLGARGLFPTTVVAVVKRHHRPALITLAAAAPSIETLYVLDYVAHLKPRRVEKEFDYVQRLSDGGTDLLRRTLNGWRRTTAGG